MAYRKSNAVNKNRPAVNSAEAGEVVVVPFSYTASTAVALNDVIGLCKLPARHVPVDCFLSIPDLDAGAVAALVHSVGFYADNDAGDTVVDVDAMISASTVGQAAGVERMDEAAGISLAPADVDRVLALTVTTGPAGGGTSATPITGWFSYRSASYDD